MVCGVGNVKGGRRKRGEEEVMMRCEGGRGVGNITGRTEYGWGRVRGEVRKEKRKLPNWQLQNEQEVDKASNLFAQR